MDDTTITILFLLVAIIGGIPTCRLFYNRYFNDYKNQIDTFLKSNNLTFKRKLKPETSDWDRSPFNKPPAISFSIGFVKLGGMTTSTSDTQYVIIETKQGNRIWLEVQTTFLFKPKLSFKNELQPPPLRKTDDKIKSECPACQYIVFDTDEICPDCGLHLK